MFRRKKFKKLQHDLELATDKANYAVRTLQELMNYFEISRVTYAEYTTIEKTKSIQRKVKRNVKK